MVIGYSIFRQAGVRVQGWHGNTCWGIISRRGIGRSITARKRSMLLTMSQGLRLRAVLVCTSKKQFSKSYWRNAQRSILYECFWARRKFEGLNSCDNWFTIILDSSKLFRLYWGLRSNRPELMCRGKRPMESIAPEDCYRSGADRHEAMDIGCSEKPWQTERSEEKQCIRWSLRRMSLPRAEVWSI